MFKFCEASEKIIKDKTNIVSVNARLHDTYIGDNWLKLCFLEKVKSVTINEDYCQIQAVYDNSEHNWIRRNTEYIKSLPSFNVDIQPPDTFYAVIVGIAIFMLFFLMIVFNMNIGLATALSIGMCVLLYFISYTKLFISEFSIVNIKWDRKTVIQEMRKYKVLNNTYKNTADDELCHMMNEIGN